ncbi:MBL fold metallo-hydrolase [Pseudoclavibacter chungangensis]|uniref:MBL fold metallo-hydrolase n=1 Tax=Pseudoclavibacter chungangensis TaxID=587635 RepID=A0A7J5C1P1_9MICO|nr:MBL fold metallo-hydrolase [Pseudoclavibacter chungangensis]KAB1659652.1 MBL fold metallo-hydrolase [Pseudoclavibacter chungangensis]NYJ67489.1 L-ascorbate metabolism protein UlaG (beta-lactamase superfamily) [Pseudoclavibacter chungangensis]
MKLTKLEHSCLLLEKGSSRLLVDPGNLTTPITEATGAVGIVVTHEHPDHWTREQLARVAASNPGLRVFTTAGAAKAISAEPIEGVAGVVVAEPGSTHDAAPFTLRFYGGVHAEIHSSIPRIDNIGVVVDDGVLAYGGDSFDAPADEDGEPIRVDVLAVAEYGPWMRIADSMDLIERVRPKRVVGVHEMLLARAGKELAASRLRDAVESVGGHYLDLQPYESVDLD